MRPSKKDVEPTENLPSLCKSILMLTSLSKKQEELIAELREVLLEKVKLIDSNQALRSEVSRIQSHSEVMEKRNSLLQEFVVQLQRKAMQRELTINEFKVDVDQASTAL